VQPLCVARANVTSEREGCFDNILNEEYTARKSIALVVLPSPATQTFRRTPSFVIVGVLGRAGKGGRDRRGEREDRKGELKAPGLPICHALSLSLSLSLSLFLPPSQSEEGRKGAANEGGERG